MLPTLPSGRVEIRFANFGAGVAPTFSLNPLPNQKCHPGEGRDPLAVPLAAASEVCCAGQEKLS